MISIDSPVDRRTALGLLGAGALLGGTSSARAADADRSKIQTTFDFSDPKDNLTAYVKLTSSLDGEPVVGWYSGMLFGVMNDDILKPLARLEGFGVGKCVRQSDGTYKSSWKEVGYYKDVATDKIIERWRNPYTGEDTEVLHIHNASVSTVLAPQYPDFSKMPGLEGRGVKMEFPNYTRASDPSRPFVLPWTVQGDTVYLWNDFRARVKNALDPKVWVRESTGEFIRVSEFFQYVGSLAELQNPDLPRVAATGTWNRLAPWLPWMLMGGQPGHIFYRCNTRKLERFEQLPKDILAYTQKHYPQYLVYETPWKMPNESSWEVYKRERKPVAAKG